MVRHVYGQPEEMGELVWLEVTKVGSTRYGAVIEQGRKERAAMDTLHGYS